MVKLGEFRGTGVYIPKDTAEMRCILEALRTYSALQGMATLSEMLGDAEIALAMEELEADRSETVPASGPQENPGQR